MRKLSLRESILLFIVIPLFIIFALDFHLGFKGLLSGIVVQICAGVLLVSLGPRIANYEAVEI